MLFLIIGPSGVGKGTVVSLLKKNHSQNPQFFFPITATTRLPRPREVDGVDYYFLSREVFEKKIAEGEFLEHAFVHKKDFYGLPKATVMLALKEGKAVVREIDIQGFESIRKILSAREIVSLFLLPPSLEILEERIRKRSDLPETEVRRRMESAKQEIALSKECDFLLYSEDGNPEKTANEIERIITEKMKPPFFDNSL
jgi:guanylate kinase